MSVFYLVDNNRRALLHAAGINDTSAYIPAILHHLGVTGHAITPDQLDTLTESDVLLAVRTPLPALPCTIISFAASQDPMMSVEEKMYGQLLADGKSLAIFAPIFPEGEGEEVLATAVCEDGSVVPAWIRTGKRYDYAFDLPASVWYSGDGYPAPGGKNMFNFSFGVGRVPDMRPLPIPYDTSVAYNDELCCQLRNILLAAGVPMFHTLPPLSDGSVPDFALHFSGDDDACSASLNLTAALNMESFGLPYHINAMPADDTRFVMDRDVYEELKRHGCETALHTNFYGRPYTAETQAKQVELFRKIFGELPKTNVNHCLIQDGSTAERLSWLESHGIGGDNDKMGEIDTNDINAFNLTGYAFGTSFPRYTCTDAKDGNRVVRTLDIPITYYEPRLDSDRYNNEPQILQYLENSAAHGRISQFFIHPHYLNPSYDRITSTFAAIKRIQAYIREKQYKVWYTTTDTITAYWHNRSASTLEADGAGNWKLYAACALCVLLPEGVESIQCGGEQLSLEKRVVSGREVTIAAVPAAGEYTLVLA